MFDNDQCSCRAKSSPFTSKLLLVPVSILLFDKNHSEGVRVCARSGVKTGPAEQKPASTA